MTGTRAAPAAAGSLISAELKIVGNLNSAGDLRIDGAVEGDISSRTLTIGESARVEGSIAAETVRISGTVSGHIKATNVAIARTARVSGDITYRTLSVEEGGVLEGQCRRSEGDNVATLRAGPASTKSSSAEAALPAG
ncbi:MAG: polymer-forming cytoskeletal protein [Alphaproteobacteria bacterium]